MKLSRTERWILSNQYQILALLDRENAEAHNHTREILDCGYELMYEWQIEQVYDDPHIMSTEECREVLEILKMFSSLKSAYEALEDKSAIQDTLLRFSGFSGNDETKQMAFARFFCQSRNAFAELDRGDDFNSHFPSLGTYRRQLEEFRKCRDQLNPSRDELVRIAEAAVHPDNRQQNASA
jgi:uncharacterized protein